MIEEILAYVPSKSVTLTCTKFNDIVISKKFFEIIFISTKHELNPFRLLDNDDVFGSMMESRRRFKTFCIKGHRNIVDLECSSLNRLTQFIERFGKDIKQVGIAHFVLPPNFTKLLNLMPKLEKFVTMNVKKDIKNFIEGELELHKLKEVTTKGCSMDFFSFFNGLPPGVLQEIMLCLPKNPIHSSVPLKLFQNQHKVKKMIVDVVFFDCINWKQMKLKEIMVVNDSRISITESCIARILKGQDELEILRLPNINAPFDLICNELKSLVKLTAPVFGTVSAGSKLSNLRHLKELELWFPYVDQMTISSKGVDSFISSLRNESLEKISIKCYHHMTELSFSQIRSNFPQLQDASICSNNQALII